MKLAHFFLFGTKDIGFFKLFIEDRGLMKSAVETTIVFEKKLIKCANLVDKCNFARSFIF